MNPAGEISTEHAPAPAGPYSQAVRAGDLVFLAGQVPRTPNGERLGARPFAEQARQTLENLEAVARASGASLQDAVKVNVYLTDPARRPEFDAIYERYVGNPLPARTTTQSHLPDVEVEVDAVLYVPVGRPTPQ